MTSERSLGPVCPVQTTASECGQLTLDFLVAMASARRNDRSDSDFLCDE